MIMKSLSIFLAVENGKEFLWHSNLLDQTITVYDLSARKIVKKIMLDKKGPNSVGKTPTGFYPKNMDSIFVWSHSDNLLSMISSEGELQFQLELSANVFAGEPSPWVGTSSPMHFRQPNNELILSTVVRIPPNKRQYSKAGAAAAINLEERAIRTLANYPSVYDRGYWREHNFCNVSLAPSLGKNDFYFSFGVDHSIRSIRGSSFEVRSKYLKDFKPIDNYYNSTKTYSNAGTQVLLQGYYAALVTDEVRQKYYRLVSLPLSRDEIKKGIRSGRYSLIVLDKSKTVEGEYLIPQQLDPHMFFVSKRGLYMANKDAYKQNEDLMTFSRLVLPQ